MSAIKDDFSHMELAFHGDILAPYVVDWWSGNWGWCSLQLALKQCPNGQTYMNEDDLNVQ